MASKPRKMIDPDTGLELTVLEPAPAMRASRWYDGADSAPIFDPNMQGNVVPDPAAIQPVVDPMESPPPASGSAPMRSSMLDSVLFTLFGTPDSKLSPEEESEAHAERQSAGAMSKSAAKNPGRQWMDIPNAGGNSLGESLDKPLSMIVRLFSGGGS